MEKVLDKFRSPYDRNRFHFVPEIVNTAWLQRRRARHPEQGNDFPLTGEDSSFLAISSNWNDYHCFAPDSAELEEFLSHLRSCAATTTIGVSIKHRPVDEEEVMLRFMKSIQNHGNLVEITVNTVGMSQYLLDLIGASRSLLELRILLDGGRLAIREDHTILEAALTASLWHHPSLSHVTLHVTSWEGLNEYSMEAQQEVGRRVENIGRALVHVPNLCALYLISSFEDEDENDELDEIRPWLPSNSLAAIMRKPHFQDLRLRGWSIRMEDLQILADGFADSSLQSLYLEDLQHEESIRLLLSGIGKAQSLVQLRLCFCQPLSLDSALGLFDLLVQQKELQTFTLDVTGANCIHGESDGEIRPDYAACAVAKSLGQSSTKIRRLQLISVNMDDTGYRDLEKKRRHPSSTAIARENLTIAAELAKSLGCNPSAVLSLDLSHSLITIPSFQGIADSLIGNNECGLETLLLSSLKNPSGDSSPNEEIHGMMDVALQLAVGCPSLNKIEIPSFDEHIVDISRGLPLPSAWSNNEDGFRAREEVLRVAITRNYTRLHTHLRFNSICKYVIRQPEHEKKLACIVGMLAEYTEEQGVLFEVLRLFPRLCR